MADGDGKITGVGAQGIAGDLSGKPQPPINATLHSEVGNFTLQSSVTAETTVTRAPFSEAGMAERFVVDRVFYRNLAGFVAAEVRRQAVAIPAKGNLDAATKSQLNELADGFQEIATGLSPSVLTPQAASVVASLVTKLRETYTAIMENHPELIQLASIGLAAYALHHFGFADPDLSLLISTAVVKKEKLSQIIKAWKHGK